MSALSRLMLVSDRRRFGAENLLSSIAAALAAGPFMVQIREKDLSDAIIFEMIESLRQKVGRDSVVIVNGCPGVAARTGAGLHLPAVQAAELDTRPPCRLLGCSVHSTGEIESARSLAPDYLVAGTVFGTGSKPGVRGCGTAGLSRLVAAADGVPVYAIGGMKPEHVEAVLGAGAYGVAVSGGILSAVDPALAARRFLEALGERGTLSV